MRDPYEVLGVSRSASPEELKAAFRKLAKLHHPDTNPGDPSASSRFDEVTKAYEALTKEPSRAEQHSNEWDVGDLLHQEMMKAFRRQQEEMYRRAANSDILTSVEIGLEDVFRGCQVEVRLGTGQTLSVTVPRGIQHGQRLRIAGGGLQRDMRFSPGDLHVEIRVRSHDRFQRVNSTTLVMNVQIDSLEAIVGGEVEVDMIDGERVIVPYPSGTQHGDRIRVQGRGLPYLQQGAPESASRGDLYVAFSLHTPTVLTLRHRELVNELQKILPTDPTAT